MSLNRSSSRVVQSNGVLVRSYMITFIFGFRALGSGFKVRDSEG